MKKSIIISLLAYIPAGFLLVSILQVVILKWAPVTVTPLMLKRSLCHVDRMPGHQWKPLDEVSPNMIKAVIAGEDQRFFLHNGFDFDEIRRMKKAYLFDGSPIRGCSTISQQTAKNCFTFGSRTIIRKGIEAYYTVLIERFWGKKRILEVYLNVAEMGPGVYGVEAASKEYFHIHADEITAADASSLVCCLPNPLHRSPEWADRYMGKRRFEIAQICNYLQLPINLFYNQ